MIVVEHRDGWQAIVTDGVWASDEPDVAALLQAVTDREQGYKPDREWTVAAIARDFFEGTLRIVSDPAPEPDLDPNVVY